MKLPYINMITQQEFCEHIEDDDFLRRYGNPVAVQAEDGSILVCMAIEYYEHMIGHRVEISSDEIKHRGDWNDDQNNSTR